MDRINRQNSNEHEENKSSGEINDIDYEGRQKYEVDIDRMINEGLGGGYITNDNGRVDDVNIDELE